MYFNNSGLGNFYALSSDDTKLRGIVVMKSDTNSSKKIDSGKWTSLSALEVDLNSMYNPMPI
jgi:hypothetical protein